MKKQRLLLCFNALMFLCCTVSCAGVKDPGECMASGDPFMEATLTNTQIVVFDEAADIPAHLYEIKGLEILPHLKMAIIPNDENIYERLIHEPTVINIVPDLKIHSVAEAAIVGRIITNEEKASWGVDRVQAPVLWGLGYRGQGVRVAVLDSGVIPDFPDLGMRVVSAKNFTGPESSDWVDKTGHGTSVASIIAAAENGEFTRGVAPEVSLFIAKVLNERNWGADSFFVRALEWAIENNVRIANMSIGEYESHEIFDQAINRAMSNGLLIIAAAGNDGNPGCRGSNVFSPAKYKLVLAVGATDQADAVAGFSSHGPEVDVAAPGVNLGDILTVKPLAYGTGMGTSYASPHVTGVAALILSYAPRLTPYQLFTVLTLSAEDFGTDGKDDYYGYGIVNAEKAMRYIEDNKL